MNNLFAALNTDNMTIETLSAPEFAREQAEVELERMVEDATYPRYGYTTAQVFENDDEYGAFLREILEEELVEFTSVYDALVAEYEASEEVSTTKTIIAKPYVGTVLPFELEAMSPPRIAGFQCACPYARKIPS